jgi:LacI family transcriptional regulator, galactose operon repressor
VIETPRIALVMGLADHFDREVVRGVIRFSKNRPGWQLFGHGWMFSPLDDLAHWNGDGVIARVESTGMAELLASLHLPIVDVAGAYLHYGFESIKNDDVATGRLVGKYLTDRGLRNFAFFGVTGADWSHARERGFEESVLGSMSDTGVGSFTRPLTWWKTPGTNAEVADFVADLPRPAGAFACNDATALKVLLACRSVGRMVPDELAVVGVDNEDITCEIAQPALSSVALDLEKIGYQAADRLDLILHGRGAESAHTRIPPSRLHERVSSRIFPTKDPLVRRALEMIHGRVDSGISTPDLIEAIPLSRRSLEIRFRRETGKTLHRAIMDARLARACDLLRDTETKIAAVSHESGFQSIQRFFEVFRTHLGVTPGEYRRIHGGRGSQIEM